MEFYHTVGQDTIRSHLGTGAGSFKRVLGGRPIWWVVYH